MQMWCFTVWVADSKVVPQRSYRWALSLPDVPWGDERKMETARLRLPASFLPSKILGQFRQSCFCLSSALLILNHSLCSTNSTQAQSPQTPTQGGARAVINTFGLLFISTSAWPKQTNHSNVYVTVWWWDVEIVKWTGTEENTTSAFIHNEVDNTFYDMQ